MIKKSTIYFVAAFSVWIVMSTVFAPGGIYYLLFLFGFLLFCYGGILFFSEKIRQIKNFFGK